MFHDPFFASDSILLSVFIIQLLCFLWVLRKYHTNSTYVFIILCWFPALFIASHTYDLYILVLFFYALFLLIKSGEIFSNKKYLLVFILFTLVFMICEIINAEDALVTSMSQYSRYFKIFVLSVLVRKDILVKRNIKTFTSLIYNLLLIQIGISIFKSITFYNAFSEGYVGTISLAGGAIGTTLPLIACIFYIIIKHHEIHKKDWLFILGLFFIGLATGKRAIIFMLPIVIFLGLYFIPKKNLKFSPRSILTIALIPLFFYIGVRLSWTLNPDHKVWGRFDLEYVINYADSYQNGNDEFKTTRLRFRGSKMVLDKKDDTYYGRTGATIGLFYALINFKSFPIKEYFGYGYSKLYAISYDDFLRLPLSIKIWSKGSITGFYQSYATIGIIGMFMSIFWFFTYIFDIKNFRLKITILLITGWDYFFYNGFTIREPILMTIIFFVIYYSNLVYKEKYCDVY